MLRNTEVKPRHLSGMTVILYLVIRKEERSYSRTGKKKSMKSEVLSKKLIKFHYLNKNWPVTGSTYSTRNTYSITKKFKRKPVKDMALSQWTLLSR